jgi:hypothetical protein
MKLKLRHSLLLLSLIPAVFVQAQTSAVKSHEKVIKCPSNTDFQNFINNQTASETVKYTTDDYGLHKQSLTADKLNTVIEWYGEWNEHKKIHKNFIFKPSFAALKQSVITALAKPVKITSTATLSVEGPNKKSPIYKCSYKATDKNGNKIVIMLTTNG